MNNHRNLAVLDAADLVVCEVNQLIDSAPRPLIHIAQLRDSAQSVSANISEGFGRGGDGERNRALRIARGEAEEAIRHLQANLQAGRITEPVFLRLRNRLITIVRMLTSLLNH